MKKIFLAVFCILANDYVNGAAMSTEPSDWETLMCNSDIPGLTLEANREAIRICERSVEKIRIPISTSSAAVSWLINAELKRTHSVFEVTKEGLAYTVDLKRKITPLMRRGAASTMRVAVGAAGAVAVCTHEIYDFLVDKNIQLTAAVEMKDGKRVEIEGEWKKAELTSVRIQYYHGAAASGE